jgi:hypothetical protein
MLELKDIIARAKDYIRSTFADESPDDLLLEEVELDSSSGQWAITISFIRVEAVGPKTGGLRLPPEIVPAAARTRRVFKIVRIDGKTGDLVAIHNREVGLVG